MNQLTNTRPALSEPPGLARRSTRRGQAPPLAWLCPASEPPGLARRSTRRGQAPPLAWLVGLAILFTAGPAQAQQKPRTAVPEARIDQRLDTQVPLDLTFRDEAGHARVLREYFKGKPVILVLAYFRCPRLCSLVLNGLSDALKQIKEYEIGREFDVVTVSIDPRETPELAAAKKQAQVEEYARPGAAEGWHFLTGDADAIERLADAVGYRYFYDATKDEFAHASGIMVLTPAGKISRYYYGIKYVPLDIRYGLEDAADEQIGSPVSRPLRLLCFDYDPSTGRYSVAVLRLVRVGGVLTMLAIASIVFFSWRRGRRPKAVVQSREGTPC